MFFLLFMYLVVFPLILFSFFFFCIFCMIPLAFIIASWYMRIKERKLQRRKKEGANVAFFHPYCNAGGGGERVLWVAIKALLARYPDTNIYIYTVETAEPQTILDKAQNQFNVKVSPDRINFVRLSLKWAIEAKSYPYFTLILQSLGSMFLGLEALLKLNPDIYIDTTGFAFTYPIFRYLAQCPVGCYTHYPTITTAMMRRVKHRVVSYNNSSLIARNPLYTWCKLLYYKIFGWLYGVAGRCADIVMVNGTWTEDHINELWRIPFNTIRVYPPCEVNDLKQLRSLVKETDPIRILSVAQFRPEKDHPLMLQAMYELRNLLVKNEVLWNKIKLVLVGSCRNPEDEERVQNLKDLAKHLSLEDSVQFVVNAPYARLLQLYQTSSIGLHAMWNEHFGISVVECMAAGLITVAHRSGGPLADIIETSVGARTGYLATEADDYARSILEVIALPSDERKKIIESARFVIQGVTVAHRSGGPLADIIETSVGARTGYLATEADDYARSILEVIALPSDERKKIIESARFVIQGVTVAHRSGGPLADIIETSVGARTGYLATEADDYARSILEVIALPSDERKKIIESARFVIQGVTVAHRSGGPLADIIETSVGARTGYLATEADDYARSILEVIALPSDERKKIIESARFVIQGVTVAHRSGGPLADIIETSVGARTGYLATEADDYARSILEVIALPSDERKKIIESARFVIQGVTVAHRSGGPLADIIETSVGARTGYLATEADDYARSILEVIALPSDERKKIIESARFVIQGVTVAHRSGGPLADIIETSVGARTGYLATEADDYARSILEVIALSSDERKKIIESARFVIQGVTVAHRSGGPLADIIETSVGARTGYLATEADDYARSILEVIALPSDERKKIIESARFVIQGVTVAHRSGGPLADIIETSVGARTGYLATEADDYARSILEVIALPSDERKKIIESARFVIQGVTVAHRSGGPLADIIETSVGARTGYLATEADDYARSILEVIALPSDERKKIIESARFVIQGVTVAHRSGGPLADIIETSVGARTGYLATEADDYARSILEVIALPSDERKKIIESARFVIQGVTVAHRSGGPLADIIETSVGARTGYLATEADDYARSILEVIALPSDERKKIIESARFVIQGVTVAHRSGGPLADIIETSVGARTGYLATEADDYARSILEVIALPSDERKKIIESARFVIQGVTVAHRSGGPLADIIETSVGARTGYLATEADDYARSILEVIALPSDERKKIIESARFVIQGVTVAHRSGGPLADIIETSVGARTGYLATEADDYARSILEVIALPSDERKKIIESARFVIQGVTVAHRSGGPLADIIETSVGARTGYLATEADDYARSILEVIALPSDERKKIIESARFVIQGVTVAHRSGGPLADIIETSVGARTGYLATEADDYARSILEVIALPSDERKKIIESARFVIQGVTVAHRSGGPLADIIETSVGARTGYLATEADDYARSILEVIALPSDERKKIIESARFVIQGVTVAHRSGGPLADIIETSVGARTGYLATEADDYARSILEVIALPSDERKKIIESARFVIQGVTVAHRSGGPLADIIETPVGARTGYLATEAENN